MGGEVAEWVYDERGRVTRETDALGGITRYSYDDDNHIVAVTSPLGSAEFEFTETGSLRISTTPLGNRVVALRDANTLTLEDSIGPLLVADRDDRGNTVSVTRATGRRTKFAFDSLSRMVSLSSAGHTASRTYDALGYLIRTRDLAGNENHYERDLFGLLLKWTNAGGLVVTYEYDEERRLIRSRSSSGAQCAFTYDLYGRVQKELLRDGRTEEFEYDESGNRSSVVSSGGIVTLYRYTSAGYIAEMSSGDHAATYCYDASGNCVQADACGYCVKRTYGPGDLLLREDQDGFLIEYEYGPAGLLKTRTDATGRRAEYEYNLRGQLLTIRDSATGTHSFEYDRYGRKAAHLLPNGILRRFSYNPEDQIASVRTSREDGFLPDASTSIPPLES